MDAALRELARGLPYAGRMTARELASGDVRLIPLTAAHADAVLRGDRVVGMVQYGEELEPKCRSASIQIASAGAAFLGRWSQD